MRTEPELKADSSQNNSDATSPFYIAVAGAAERHSRALKHGDTFALFNATGDIINGQDSWEGIYHRDTRVLSDYRLAIDGQHLLLLNSVVVDNNIVLSADLTNPDLFQHGSVIRPRDTIHIHRSKYIYEAACHERIAISNYSGDEQNIKVTLSFDADFADIFEVRGQRRPHGHGHRKIEIKNKRQVIFIYTGLDAIKRTTVISFDPIPHVLRKDRASFELQLAARSSVSLFVETTAQNSDEPLPTNRGFFRVLHRARTMQRQANAHTVKVTTSNNQFNQIVRRAFADIYMLVTETEHGLYPYAGIPWFSTAFGRDAILTSLFMLWVDPRLASGVLRFLAANQATEFDPISDAEPGKILHELRQGEMANLNEVPFAHYYGSVDATPLFIWLAALYLERTGDLLLIRQLWPAIKRALNWLDVYGDRDKDGFIEYERATESGLSNQGWKDSSDSIFHADGQLARGPIALVEVQAYAYAAKRGAAMIARRLAHATDAAELDLDADRLRENFEEKFWLEELGTYALAIDGDKRPCSVFSSNAAHTLLTGIAAPDRAARLVHELMAPANFSGWGIRTVTRNAPRFNPMSYHNGSIWPHDNAFIALGLAHYGHTDAAVLIFESLIDAAGYMDLQRLPELFCGFPRQTARGPTSYPVACAPQAWASAAIFALLQASLGLSFDPLHSRIRFRHPRLPSFLENLTLQGIALNGGSVDAFLNGQGHQVAVGLSQREGPIGIDVIL